MDTSVLDKAKEILNGKRQEMYGAVENNFNSIAEYWSTYLSECPNNPNLMPHDVAAMMTLLKIARLQGDEYNEDNIVDAIGYLTIYSHLMSKC